MMTLPNDAQIRQDIFKEFEWDARVGAYGIGITVDNGTVTLDGTVETYGRRHAALQAAARVDGVVAVNNQLRVGSTSQTASHNAALVA